MSTIGRRSVRIALCSAGIAAGLVTSAAPASAAASAPAAVWRANALSGPPVQHWFGLGPTPAAARSNALTFCHRHAMRPQTCHVVSIVRAR